MIVVKLEKQLTVEDIEILIRYSKEDRRIERLDAYAKSLDNQIECVADDNVLWVNASDILYIESVDKRTFVYTGSEVYRTDKRLYQLLDSLSDSRFVQTNKACIVNLYQLKSIRTLANSRMEGTLLNGEKITINRKYIADIKEKLIRR